MTNNQFMVLGVKDLAVKDPNTEKDNPYIFNSLERAVEVARQVADLDDYASIVKIEILAELSGGKNNEIG